MRWPAVLLILALVGCGSDEPRVAIVGDSITKLAAPHLTVDAAIEARNGRRIEDMLPAIRRQVAADPDVLIVNLGTNDAVKDQQYPDWRSGYDELVRLAAPVPCVYLTTISRWIDEGYGGTVAAQLNREIRSSDFGVIDWDQLLTPEDIERYVKLDGVHPTEAGARWLAEQYNGAAQRGC